METCLQIGFACEDEAADAATEATWQAKWSKVTGPMSALIAMMWPIGLALRYMDFGCPPGPGASSVVGPLQPPHGLLGRMLADVRTALSKLALPHGCGAGSSSAPEPVSFRLLKQLRREGNHTNAGML